MKRIVFRLLMTLAVLAIAAYPNRRAAADDETADTEIKIHASLDAVDCTGNTISVLGLTIDIGTAAIDAGDSGGSDEMGSEGIDDNGDNSGGTGAGPTGCAALVALQSVEVKLQSDTPDPTTSHLVATEVSQNGDDNEVKIEALLQPIDANGDATDGQSIQLLGLKVDVSQLTQQQQGQGLEGDDDSGNPTGAPVSPDNLVVGQFVEVQLDPSQLPALVATELHVKNFTNQVDVEVDDQAGNEVDDTSDDVTVKVDDTVTVQPPPTPGAATARSPRKVRKIVKLQMTSHGSFTLSGLPTGRAKIIITRGTSVGRRSLLIKPNAQGHTRIRLHRSR